MESIAKLQPVTPVSPVAPYMGGKKNLARVITSIIARIPHDLYAEPFVGMGGIFFRRALKPKNEVINDISGDVHALFLSLREHYAFFLELVRFQLTSRREFERLASQPSSSLTELQRAARFLYLQRTAFGGKVGGNYGVDPARPARFDITRLAPMLDDVHTRLAGVAIEQLPYGKFIAAYDRPTTLFYLDPPYWNCERDYGDGIFSKADFAAIAAQLADIKGRFLLSINDTPEIREIFAAFDQHAVDTTYTFGNKHTGKGKRAGELLITNVAPEIITGAAAAANDS